jgi:hypothetical protein
VSAPRPTEAQDEALLLISHGWIWVNNPNLYGWRRTRPATVDVLERNGWAELRREPDGRIYARITLAGRIAYGFAPVTITKPRLATFVKANGKTFVACDARDEVPSAKQRNSRLRDLTLTAEVGTQIAWAYWDGTRWAYDLMNEVPS